VTLYSSQPGSGASRDTFVQENGTSLDNSAVDPLSTRNVASSRRHSLLWFDLSSIPAGSTINSASLYLANASQSLRTFTLHRILPANSGWVHTCNWNYRVPSTTRWAGDTGSDGGTDAGCSVSGTDYSATVMCSMTFLSTDVTGTFKQFVLDTTEVANMLANNHGMIIVRVDTNAIFGLQSSEHATAGLRPKLEIDYTAAGGTDTPKAVAGTLTTAGAVKRATTKSVAGTLAIAGAVRRATTKAAAGTLTMAGALATKIGFSKAVAGTLALAGTLGLQAAFKKAVAGTLTTAGAISKAITKSAAGTLTTAGAVVRKRGYARALAGTLTTAGALAAYTQLTQAVGGTLVLAGTVKKGIGRALAGVLSLSGILSTFFPNAPFASLTVTDSAVTNATLTVVKATNATTSDSHVTSVTLSRS
jgi:hypothetical protein